METIQPALCNGGCRIRGMVTKETIEKTKKSECRNIKYPLLAKRLTVFTYKPNRVMEMLCLVSGWIDSAPTGIAVIGISCLQINKQGKVRFKVEYGHRISINTYNFSP